MPFVVAAYVTSAYWFTASTSFANPAVTLARAATDTFSGIRPADVPAFVAAQALGATAATALALALRGGGSAHRSRRTRGGTPPPRCRVKIVIFACVHSAGRSQMAAALFNARVDRHRPLGRHPPAC